MLLRELTIKNYKSLEDVTISGIRDLMVFVGPNNAGKTCILEVLRQIPNLNFSGFTAGAQGVTGRNQDRTIEVTLSFEIEEPRRRQSLMETHPYGLRAG